ncbi:hypothetical protein [Ancylobacter mangrovi]|nr:hypothetical protein [Ancylobacter mangrovi]
MDDLTEKLKARGIDASVHSYVDWKTLADQAIAEAKENGSRRRPAPVIIIGHSLGADAAVYMGNKVSAAGVPVPLVVTFDPVTPTVASAKIGKVVNYYQGGGSGKPVSGPRVDNIDLTGTPSLSHFTIDKAADLHAKVIAMIVKSPRQVARRRPLPKNPPMPTPMPTAETASAPPVPSVAVPAVQRTPN